MPNAVAPTVPNFRRLHQVAGVCVLLPVVLLLDSPWLAERLPYNQWLANVVTFAYFAWVYTTASARLRGLLSIGLVVATIGEVVFALGIDMYEYRLHNVPLYVPPGHTLLYAAVYYFVREPWVRRHAAAVRRTALAAATVFSVVWLLAQNDVYGFICFLAFMAIVAVNRDSRMFFPVMFVVVAYLELIGTAVGNWWWWPTLLDNPGWIPSGNPPAGIAVFYFGFDIACLGVYMLTHLKIRVRYDAQKAHRKAHRTATTAVPAPLRPGGGVVAAVLLAVALPLAAGCNKQAAVPDNIAAAAATQAVDLDAQCAELIGEPTVHQLGQYIYAAVGFDLGSTIAIRTDDGLVVVDTGISVERGLQVRAAIEAAIGERLPVRAIVYTHSHADHIGGASVWADADTQIWATDAFVEHLVKQYGMFQPLEAMRGRRQFGMGLTAEAGVCSGLGGQVLKGGELMTGLRMPTHTFSGQTSMTIGGVEIHLVEAHGETDDQLLVWLPGMRALLPGDNIYKAFPNLYTIRGTRARPVDKWIASLDAMRRLQPALLVPSHTAPVTGSATIAAILTAYRDAIQYVRDESVRLALAGRTPNQIAAELRLPPHLATHPYLAQIYGQVDWGARGIFGSNVGWFGGEAIELYPLPPADLAAREIAHMGGAAAVLVAAEAALAAGEARWAAHLATKLRTAADLDAAPRPARAGGDGKGVAAELDVERVNRLLAAALRAIALTVPNTNGRAYLLVRANELEGEFAGWLKPDMDDITLAGIPLDAVFGVLPTRLIAESAGDVHEALAFRFRDTGERYTVTIRRGVAEVIKGEPLPATPAPVATVIADSLTFKKLTLGKISGVKALASDGVDLEGSKLAALQFLGRFRQGL